MEFDVARPEELPQLVALLTILFSQEEEFSPDYEKQMRALERILADPSVGTVYVARDEGQVIGMASVLYTVSTAEGGTAALFEDLVVLPTHRDQGTGRALVAFIIAEERRRGVLRLTLLTDASNERAQAFYRSLGFTDSPMKPMRLKL